MSDGGLHGFMESTHERQSVTPDGFSGSGKSPKRSRGVIVTIALVLVAIVVAGIVGVMSLFGGSSDYAGAGSGTAIVVVKSGDTLTAIGDTLLAAGVVKSQAAFIAATKANPNSTLVAPGTYRLAKQMKASLALNALLNPSARISHVVVVPEAARAAGVVDIASRVTGIAKSEFDAVLAAPNGLGLPSWAHNKAEGFLFPATYTFDPKATATDVLSRMVARFGQSSDAMGLVANAAAIHESPYAVVTVASIIGREVAPRDYSKAARVIYNRLAQGMPLQLDSTVAYGLGIKRFNLTAAQLAKDTPYNTYLHKGLPPTPIGNPGDAALYAALHPASGSWVYFVTVNLNTQETRFSSTYAQFLRDKQAFLNWMASNG